MTNGTDKWDVAAASCGQGRAEFWLCRIAAHR